ncbi:MAG: Rpp14/Pop5 family protein [Sulfolobales archaeon]
METWLESILILLALTLSITSVSISIWLYISMKRQHLVSMESSVEYKRPRHSKRYMVFRIYRIKGEIDFENLDKCFKNHFAEQLGIFDDVERSLKLVRYNAQSGVGIVRIVSTDIYKTIFAISRLRRCGDAVIIVMPIKITGTLRRAIKRAHEYDSRYGVAQRSV